MKPKLLIILAFLAALLAIGCVQEPVKPTPTPTVTPASTPVYTYTPTPEPTPEITPTPSGEEATVWIEDYAFFPKEMTIKAGTKVIWRNWIKQRYEDIIILGEENSWKSTPFGYGQNWNRTFYAPGVYNYTASFSGTELKTVRGAITVTP